MPKGGMPDYEALTVRGEKAAMRIRKIKPYLIILSIAWIIDLIFVTFPIMLFYTLFSFDSNWYYLIVIPLVIFVSYKGAKISKRILIGLFCAVIYIFFCRYLTPHILDSIFNISPLEAYGYTEKDVFLGSILSFVIVLPLIFAFAIPASYLGKHSTSKNKMVLPEKLQKD